MKSLALGDSYDDNRLPFDPSLMVYFRKRLTPEVPGEINEMILKTATRTDDNDNEPCGDDSGHGENTGTLIMDATCAPSNIRFPPHSIPERIVSVSQPLIWPTLSGSHTGE